MKVVAINSIYDAEVADENGNIVQDTYNIPYRKDKDVILTDKYGYQRVLPKVLFDQLYVPVRVIKPKLKIDYEEIANAYQEMGELIKDQNEFGNNNYSDELHKIDNEYTKNKAF